MSARRTVALTLAGVALAAACAAAAVVGFGLYPVEATRTHWQSVHGVLGLAMRHAVQRAAREVTVPALGAAAQLRRGADCFATHCVQCHGAPGVAPGAIGLGMQPLPGPLVDAARHWEARELYWITRKGIRMSGMPAWEFRLADADLWALVAFLQKLPEVDPAQYRWEWAAQPGPASTRACMREEMAPARAPDPARGRTAIAQYACMGCHRVPGVTGPDTHVGPPLSGIAMQGLIAGRLANTPQNMARWLRAPHAVDPQTAMPDLAVSEEDARDMAAYLATLR